MEVMNQVTELIRNLGFPIAMVCYFAWRDVKYMAKMDSTLDLIRSYILEEKEK